MGKSITDLSSVTTVGLDLAKHVFQVHGVDASGRVVVAKAIRSVNTRAARLLTIAIEYPSGIMLFGGLPDSFAVNLLPFGAMPNLSDWGLPMTANG
jgi:hypothetical protein